MTVSFSLMFFREAIVIFSFMYCFWRNGSTYLPDSFCSCFLPSISLFCHCLHILYFLVLFLPLPSSVCYFLSCCSLSFSPDFPCLSSTFSFGFSFKSLAGILKAWLNVSGSTACFETNAQYFEGHFKGATKSQ